MKWTVVYFEQADTRQPAEIFEDTLDKSYPKLSGKLLRLLVELQVQGMHLGGGYIEKCRDYQGMWELRAIHNGMLAREFLGFDNEHIVLLHGYVKRVGQTASASDFEKAFAYWQEYTYTRCISPLEEEVN